MIHLYFHIQIPIQQFWSSKQQHSEPIYFYPTQSFRFLIIDASVLINNIQTPKMYTIMIFANTFDNITRVAILYARKFL